MSSFWACRLLRIRNELAGLLNLSVDEVGNLENKSLWTVSIWEARQFGTRKLPKSKKLVLMGLYMEGPAADFPLFKLMQVSPVMSNGCLSENSQPTSCGRLPVISKCH